MRTRLEAGCKATPRGDRRSGPRLALVASLTAGSLLAATAASADEPAPRPRRVVVAGPQEDRIATRVHQELTALGFEAVRVGALEGCARSAVVVAAADQGAIAATCSDGDQVGVWVSDGATLRLRDVVASRDEGDGARETTAVRAAEVTRATIAMREAEEEAAARRASSSPAPAPAPQPVEPTVVDKPAAKPPPAKSGRRTPSFAASAGMSALLGADANVGAFSGQIMIGVLRNVAAAARVELPVESQSLDRSPVTVSPAFAGVGADVPVTAATSFIVPRFGGGLGLAWISASKRGFAESVDPTFGGVVTTSTKDSDSVASLGAYASAALSMRIVGPLRLVVDGIFGATFNRLVARDQGVHVAYWGQPFGALALRMELMIQ